MYLHKEVVQQISHTIIAFGRYCLWLKVLVMPREEEETPTAALVLL